MAESLAQFRMNMEKVARLEKSGQISSKTERYLRAYEAGLPQDVTVRWFPKDDTKSIQVRVAELTKQDLEVWISQGLPRKVDIDQQLSSVEKGTGLIKGIYSSRYFVRHKLPILSGWEPGSWAKVFYDTPRRALIGGTLGIDTNRGDGITGVDTRAMRLEVAAGIADVRDLDRQITAKQIAVVHLDEATICQIAQDLKPFDYKVVGLSDVDSALDEILQIVEQSKSTNEDKPKAHEPKAVLLDFMTSYDASLKILKTLKNQDDTASISVIPIIEDVSRLPAEERAMVTSSIHPHPFSIDDLYYSVYFTGFRLSGDSHGFQLPGEFGMKTQQNIEGLLNTIFGVNRAYLRMMTQIANYEQRPSIAFEFKLVPGDPYDFFFLDYEWSGVKNPLHRFDWLYNIGDGG